MNLSTFKQHLSTVDHPIFQLASGELVPEHYHVTEIGLVTKQFIDCGGEMRNESVVSFQLWYADDLDHRLTAEKLLEIIDLYEKKISKDDLPIEIEYQADTVGKYWLALVENVFILVSKQTDCLAKDACGIPEKSSCCGGGCC